MKGTEEVQFFGLGMGDRADIVVDCERVFSIGELV
jgi:hypothetical protein